MNATHLKHSRFARLFSVLLALALAAGIWAVPVSADYPKDDGKFTIAIIPDTQDEASSSARIAAQWYLNRAEWLAANKDELNLKFVLHTGDMTNFPGWEYYVQGTTTQMEVASAGMEVLDNAGIRYLIALGNHDNNATKGGENQGSAWDNNPWGYSTRLLVRMTEVYNRFFPTERFPQIVQFEEGKSENSYQTFVAGGKKWMAMVLELWPRTEVVEWAKEAVASHPDYNVLIATHSYLNGSGNITTDSSYGSNSPKYLYDNLISQYPNIKFVFCGHTGSAARREDTGVHGNKIISILGAFHHGSTNPVQLLEIDANAGTASNRYYGPLTGETVHNGWSWTGLEFVEPAGEIDGIGILSTVIKVNDNVTEALPGSDKVYVKPRLTANAKALPNTLVNILAAKGDLEAGGEIIYANSEKTDRYGNVNFSFPADSDGTYTISISGENVGETVKISVANGTQVNVENLTSPAGESTVEIDDVKITGPWNTNVTLGFKYVNLSSEARSVRAVLAQYKDNGQLIDVGAQAVELQPNTAGDSVALTDIPINADTAYVRIMVFSDFGKLTPLMNATEYIR